ncbi:MAG: LCP family protein [Eggerthellaceae bacterium]|nr:LCP family protein [Eggerthellaceae bacterium]MCH4221508.1 LCP family protein [Eggerthellaceae bacterium]
MRRSNRHTDGNPSSNARADGRSYDRGARGRLNEDYPFTQDARSFEDVSRYSRSSSSARGGRRSRNAQEDLDIQPEHTIKDTENRYSRNVIQDRYAAQAQKRHRRKIVRNVFLIILAVILVGVGAAWAYVNHINSNLQTGIDQETRDALTQTNLTREPSYILLMGTDQSIDRDQSGDLDNTYRTDTIILARIDPVNKKVTLISMPRDTMVTLDGYGTQKLNAAYAFGGSALAVKTVSSISGVGISHFGLVDFDGFKDVIDTLGGIDVDVPMEIDDADAGGHLDAGQQTLDGDQALILCRARHAYDEYGSGDDYRAANQRLVLQALAKKILSSDVGTIANTVSALSQYVSTDLSVSDVISLAQALQGIDTDEDMYTAAMPTDPLYQNELWYEKIDQDAWTTMMKRVDSGESPTESTQVDASTGTVISNAGDESSGTSSKSSSNTPKTGQVYVRNGTSTSGLGQSVANTLSKVGYTITDVGNADSTSYTKTLVVYNDSSKQSEAEEIARTIGGSVTVQPNDGTYLMSGDFLVVVGSDYLSNN